jgi:hypothetical protein
LVCLGRHVLGNRAGHAGTLGLLVVSLLVGLEARHVLELRVVEGSWRAGLERAAKQELRRKERGELHVEAGPRSRHVILDSSGRRHSLSLVHGLGVELRNVTTARVTVIRETGDIRGESTVGETSVAVGGLGGMTESVAARGRVMGTLAMRTIEVLHVEHVRGDERVPPVVR